MTTDTQRLKFVALAIAVLMLMGGCTSQWKDENECIAQSLKGVSVERAVNFVVDACRDHFASKVPAGTGTPLSAAELALVRGRLSISVGLSEGTIYNGTSRTLTRITISIQTQPEGGPAASAPATTPAPARHLYDVDVSIAPRHAGSFSGLVLPGSVPNGWALVEALGTTAGTR